MRTIQQSMLGVMLLVVTLPAAAASPDAATTAFKQLSTLLGQWDGKFADGRAHGVSYRLTAGGSVLVETWTLGPIRESITMYHLDGDHLVATHYCPQGNQPRLQWVPGDDPKTLSFAFRDGTNLQVTDGSHQHAFWIRLQDDASYVRDETYVTNNSTPAELAALVPGPGIVYRRRR